MISYSYQDLDGCESYTFTSAWLKAKESSSIWKADLRRRLLYIDLFFFRIEWLPFFGNQNKRSHLFGKGVKKPVLLITRIHKTDLDEFHIKRIRWTPLLLYKNKSCSLTSVIQLSDWSRSSLRKNWKRNLKRSYSHPNGGKLVTLGLKSDLAEIYNLIVCASRYKSLRVPHKSEFLAFLEDHSVGILGVRCSESNELIAVRAFFRSGSTAVDFIAAAAPAAFKVYATYRLAFELITLAKEEGFHHYDLGGIDMEANKGVYNFKQGLGGTTYSTGTLALLLQMPSFT